MPCSRVSIVNFKHIIADREVIKNYYLYHTQPVFICSMSAIETLEKGRKYVQS